MATITDFTVVVLEMHQGTKMELFPYMLHSPGLTISSCVQAS